jgi:hypothetical protein
MYKFPELIFFWGMELATIVRGISLIPGMSGE